MIKTKLLNKKISSDNSRSFNPVPKNISTIYRVIAILLVIIPEQIAAIGIQINSYASYNKLPSKGIQWENMPELKIASMNIKELRQLALSLDVIGYSNKNRDQLSRILFKKLHH